MQSEHTSLSQPPIATGRLGHTKLGNVFNHVGLWPPQGPCVQAVGLSVCQHWAGEVGAGQAWWRGSCFRKRQPASMWEELQAPGNQSAMP
jgi:hypothetical protein